MQTNTSICFPSFLVNDQNAPIAQTMKMETSSNNVCELWIEPKKRRTCLVPTFRLLLSIESAQMVGLQQKLDWPNTRFTQTKTQRKTSMRAKRQVGCCTEWKTWKCVKQIRLALQTSVGEEHLSYNRLAPAETYCSTKNLSILQTFGVDEVHPVLRSVGVTSCPCPWSSGFYNKLFYF